METPTHSLPLTNALFAEHAWLPGGWRRGVLVFEDTELSAAAQEFNRYNRKKVIVADTHTAHLRIGGTFPSTNVDAFADAAEAILGLHVRYRGNDIVISR